MPGDDAISGQPVRRLNATVHRHGQMVKCQEPGPVFIKSGGRCDFIDHGINHL